MKLLIGTLGTLKCLLDAVETGLKRVRVDAPDGTFTHVNEMQYRVVGLIIQDTIRKPVRPGRPTTPVLTPNAASGTVRLSLNGNTLDLLTKDDLITTRILPVAIEPETPLVIGVSWSRDRGVT